MSAQKQKGTTAEVAVLKLLQEAGFLAVRNPPSGTKDKGDLTILAPKKIIVEVKNHKRMELSTWVDETEEETVNSGADAGVLWHHRPRKGNPEEWYVTMSGKQFLELLKMLT